MFHGNKGKHKSSLHGENLLFLMSCMSIKQQEWLLFYECLMSYSSGLEKCSINFLINFLHCSVQFLAEEVTVYRHILTFMHKSFC